MDDDSDRKPRGRGKKPTGERAGGSAGKNAKPGAVKPFKRGEAAGAGDRPKRDFKREGKPSLKRGGGARDSKPSFGKSARAGDKPFAPREGKPFQKREGPRKPSTPRGDRSEIAEDQRPKRDFKPRDGEVARGERAFNKRAEGKPFVKRDGPHSGGKPFEKRDGPRKPYAPRVDQPVSSEGGTERRFDRPKRDFADRPKPEPGYGHKPSFGKPASGGFKPRLRPVDAPAETGERIAKRLARAGIASRRDAEELIAAGRVKVNGKVLSSPAFNVSPQDVIHLDGMEIPAIERTRLFLFHKPVGVVTTNRDPEGRKTVFDVLPAELPRLMTIGRLDINTEGLLLLTNDGGLSRVLELPATGWLRRYRVRVHGAVDEKALTGLKDGIAVDGVFYGAIEASLERTQGSNAWLSIGLREGKNREVRNILGALGLEVNRLIRISYGPFQLGELPEGHVLEVKGRMLRDQLGERLVEESGANFEAEIATPFSNRPVRRIEPRPEQPERPKFTRDGDRRPIGEGGLIKNRKRRENSRDEALGKLSTSPERAKFERGERSERPKSERGEKSARTPKFGDRPDRYATFAARPGADKPEPRPRQGKKSEREQRPIEPPGQRKANVWMAPGARPIGKGRAEAEKAEADDRKARKQAFGRPAGGRPFGKSRDERSQSGEGGDRPRSRGPGKGPKPR